MVMTARERDVKILHHVGAFVISFRPVIAKLFFGGRVSACQAVLSRLQREGRLKSVNAFGGARHRYYQLEARAADEIGRPHYRTRSLGEVALNRHIAILWWSCMGKRLRFRISDDEAAEFIGCTPITGPHTIERTAEGYVLSHVYPLTPNAELSPVVRRFAERIDESCRDAALAEWIKHRQYQFVILADDDSPPIGMQSRLAELRERVFDHEFKSRFAVDPWIRVDRSADIVTINDRLRSALERTNTR